MADQPSTAKRYRPSIRANPADTTVAPLIQSPNLYCESMEPPRYYRQCILRYRQVILVPLIRAAPIGFMPILWHYRGCYETPRKSPDRCDDSAPAAKQRKNAAHGASRGREVEIERAPKGRKTNCHAERYASGLLSVPCALCVLCGDSFFRPQQRKQNHIPDRVLIGQQHANSIDADAHSPCRRHSVRQRANVVFIHLVRFIVATLALFQLRLKAGTLVLRIIQLAEAVGDLHLAGKDFPPLRPVRLVRLLLGQR